MAPSPAGAAAPPRGPRGHALLGSLRDFNRDQLGFYTRCAREYGDVVPVRLGPAPGLLIYHPDAIEEVLVTRNRDFIKSRGVRLMRAFLGDGLFTAEGDLWLRQRRLMQPAFHRQRIAAYGLVMAGYAARRAAHWHEGAVLDIHEEMMDVTRAIVAKTLFGADVSEEARVIGDASEVVMEYFGKRFGSLLAQLLPLWLPTPENLRLQRATRHLDAVVYRMIADRRRSGEDRGDLLSILLQAQDADDGSRMTDRQVRDEVMTLFLAGHETTAVALSWTFYLLAQHPEADARLADELRALGGRPPAVSDLPALRYTEMVVTEAMRLYPPAYGIGREAARATEVAGQPVPAGGIVIMPTWVVHRDERWFDEPETFRPDRWAETTARRLPRFAYFPFGGGPRQCIGNTFATVEATLILAAVAQRFRLALMPGQRVTPTPYITLRPEPGIRVRLERR
jgi:cytochrome P450